MKKLIPIFKTILKGMAIGLFISTVAIQMFMAYIMFFPDSFPKPFYLAYYNPTPKPAQTQQEVVPIVPSAPINSSAPENPSVPVNIPPAAYAAPAVNNQHNAGYINPGHGLMIETGSKIINLSEPGGRKYIRVNIVLEFAPSDIEYYKMAAEEQAAYKAQFEEEINAKMPVINDCLITLISSKTFEDIYTTEGKEKLRQEIIQALNEKLPGYTLIYVYLTEFVVQ